MQESGHPGGTGEVCRAIDSDCVPRLRAGHNIDGGQATRCKAAGYVKVSPGVDGKESMPKKGPRESVGPPTACSDSHPARSHLRAQDYRVALGVS